ncbi:MAG: glycine/sarcosine/betaine reductase selenoprotein B family protein [Acidobacteriota bacterium]
MKSNSAVPQTGPARAEPVRQYEPQQESFEEFKNSFFYGSRTDLLFKFLKSLEAPQAAEFFRALLESLGECLDDGDFNRVIELVVDWQVRGYEASEGGKSPWVYDDAPFTPLAKPLSGSRLALLTSSGHFVDGDDPEPFGVKKMSQQEAVSRIGDFLKVAPQLSAIPFDTPRGKLRVRHGGYDIRGAQAEPNVVLPLDRLRELEAEGAIGELLPEAFSFVGAASQLRLIKESAPAWAAMLQQRGVDVALLVPV